MKSTRPGLLLWLMGAMLALGTSLSSCTEIDSDDNSYRVNATLSGAQERPVPVSTPGTGTVTGSYNNINKRLFYTITWSGLTANVIAMHFHGPAGPEEVAPPVIGIMGFPPSPSGTISGNVVLTADQENQLLNGQWYFNIHTPTYPGGEIRGQVVAAQ